MFLNNNWLKYRTENISKPKFEVKSRSTPFDELSVVIYQCCAMAPTIALPRRAKLVLHCFQLLAMLLTRILEEFMVLLIPLENLVEQVRVWFDFYIVVKLGMNIFMLHGLVTLLEQPL